jgi:NAD(P)-dependent dehydrogenase (short-subunit alcohol dehydrogenase family)
MELPMAKTNLKGKAGLVTGVGTGIGRDCALLLAKKNAAVLVTDIDLVAAQGVAEENVSDGGDAVAAQCDVCDPEEVGAMIQAAITAFGRLDFAVNNAGILGAWSAS